MEQQDKNLAEAVLKHLCLNARIEGIRFGPILQVLISDNDSEKPQVRGQRYLNLLSTWAVFKTLPFSLPNSEAELPEPDEEERLRILCSLRQAEIVRIELGETQPHLLFHFEDGRVLFVNGRHDRYECWQLGVTCGDPQETWLVVADPGCGVAVWSPKSFNNGG